MDTITRLLSLSSILLLLTTAPVTAGGSPTPTLDPDTDRAVARDAGAAVTAFGLDLLRAAGASRPNVVLSPASVAMALGMARAGARGETAAQMDTVLHGLTSEAGTGHIGALRAQLAERSATVTDDQGTPHDLVLRIADTAFVQDGLPLADPWETALADDFGAAPQAVDFQAAPEEARGTINGWVSERTEARIPELVPAGVIDADTRLALVNAAYLKAPWATPFDPEDTEDGDFLRADGTAVPVPFMRVTDSFRHATRDGWQAVELPYLRGQLAMTLLLPDDPAMLRESLTGEAFDALVRDLDRGQVRVELPRFSLETATDLAAVLADLGMPIAFSDAADFSAITDAAPLAISNVIHQANIDVDEAGTEAAAATAVVMRVTGAADEPAVIRFDRPFLFALRDVPTGAVLFLGRVGDPSAD
jgi:serpin B